MNICLIGRSGCGKSTIAKRLGEEFNLKVIDSGMLRQYIADKKEDYKIIEKYMKAGDAVPDYLFFRCLKQEIESTNNKNGFIIDGVPYTKDQISFIEGILNIDKYLYIKISKETSHKRLRLRNRADYSPEFLENRDRIFDGIIEEVESALKDKLVVIDGEPEQEQVYLQVRKKMI